MIRSFLMASLKWLAAFALMAGVVALVRRYGVESYRISTDAMREALREGDFILVNKAKGWGIPSRGGVTLFTSPLARDSADSPLFISRCIGMPGDTIRVSAKGYTVNGREIPRSPRALGGYFMPLEGKGALLDALSRLRIPARELREEPLGCTLRLTTFEEFQLREELPEETARLLRTGPTDEYTLIVPRKERAYPLDEAALTACKEIILRETDGKADIRDGKLYLDGRQTNFFFFKQDYYWMLSDNAEEAVDSRHLGFIPADLVVGQAWICWYSADRRRVLKPVN